MCGVVPEILFDDNNTMYDGLIIIYFDVVYFPHTFLAAMATSVLDTLVWYFPPVQIIPKAQLKPTYFPIHTYNTHTHIGTHRESVYIIYSR